VGNFFSGSLKPTKIERHENHKGNSDDNWLALRAGRETISGLEFKEIGRAGTIEQSETNPTGDIVPN